MRPGRCPLGSRALYVNVYRYKIVRYTVREREEPVAEGPRAAPNEHRHASVRLRAASRFGRLRRAPSRISANAERFSLRADVSRIHISACQRTYKLYSIILVSRGADCSGDSAEFGLRCIRHCSNKLNPRLNRRPAARVIHIQRWKMHGDETLHILGQGCMHVQLRLGPRTLS